MSQNTPWVDPTIEVVGFLQKMSKAIGATPSNDENGIQKVLDQCDKYLGSLKELEAGFQVNSLKYDRLVAAQEDIATLECKKAKLSEENANAEQALTEAKSSAIETDRALDKRQALLDTRNNTLSSQEQASRKRCKELEDRSSGLDARHGTLESRETALLDSERRLEEVNRQVVSNQTAIGNARLLLRKLIGRTGGIDPGSLGSSTLTDFKELSQVIVDKYGNFVQEKERNMTLGKDLGTANDRLGSLRIKAGNLETKISDLEEMLSQERESNERLEQKIVLANESTRTFESADTTLRQQNQYLQDELNDEKTKAAGLKDSIREHQSRETAMRESIGQQKSIAIHYRDKNKAHEKRFKDWSAQLHDSDANVAEANAFNSLLMNELNKLNDENVRILNEEIEKRNTIAELRAKVSLAEEHRTFSEKNEQKSGNRIKELKDQNRTQEAELKQIHQSQLEISELKAKADDLEIKQVELQTSKEMCKRKDDLTRTLSRQLEEKQASLKQLTKHNQTLEFKKTDIEDDLNLKAQEKNEAIALLVQQRTQSRRLEERVKTVVGQRDIANADLAEARQENRNLGHNLEVITMNRDELRDTVKEYEDGLGGEDSAEVAQGDSGRTASDYEKLQARVARYRKERDALRERIGEAEREAAPPATEAQRHSVDNIPESSLVDNLSRRRKRQPEAGLGEIGDTPPSKHPRRSTRFDNPGRDDSSNHRDLFDEMALQQSREPESGWGLGRQGAHRPSLGKSHPETGLTLTRDEVQVPATQKDRISGNARLSAGVTVDGRTPGKPLGQDHNQGDEAEEDEDLTLLDNPQQSTPNGRDAPHDPAEDQRITTSKSNTAAQRPPPALRPGTTWVIDDVLNRRATSNQIPPSIISTVRTQIEEWDVRDPKWRRAGVGHIVCADRCCARKKAEWVNNDTNHACVKCTASRKVCCRVVKGRILALPVKGRQGESLRPINEAYWRNQ